MLHRTGHIAHFLVRYRIVLFAVMALLTVTCALMVPHVNINTDMTRYLPDDSPMKQGLDLLEQQLPHMKDQMQEFGSTLFSDASDIMPKDLPRTIGTGVAMVFLVLLVMSSSVMEVLLFLITVGFAVIINMGSNALLDSVSMMTNTITAVLQMVLSMDYSIILMNRYKQEKAKGLLPVQAMEGAIDGAAGSIFSSAFTTIVSLLMLCFIKLKIGADLGVVLAKGVSLSLICNFTVLPALIIWADKGVERTKKKVPVLPAARLAAFELRFRYVLTVVFLVAFAGFAYLQRRTPLTFAPQWESNAIDARSSENAMLLLYSNADESRIPTLLESIGADSLMRSYVSYPTLALQPRTIEELEQMAEQLGGDASAALPADMLRLVYYAQTHPQRTEKFSVSELQQSVEALREKGLVPEGMDPEALAKKLLEEEPAEADAPMEEDPVTAEVVVEEKKEDTPEPAVQDPVQEEAVVVEPARDSTALTYEHVTTPVTAQVMADATGMDARHIAMVYRMAGRKGGSMSALEFVHYVQDHILSKRSYAAMVPQDMKDRLAQSVVQIDSIVAAGPVVPADTLLVASAADTSTYSASTDSLHIVASAPVEMPAPVVQAPPTPQEILMEMALSGRRFPATRMQRALSRAGIPVTRDQMDLMYLFTAAQKQYDPQTAIAPESLLNYVADTLLVSPSLAAMVPDSTRQQVLQAREQLLSGVGQLCGPQYSAAAVLSAYDIESDATFSFIERLHAMAGSALPHTHAWIGESIMYKELKDGFPRELLLLTILTVLSIFLIVASTFRSVVVPIPLVMTILTGVYANIWASGLGGQTLYYLSYLIIQGILMGATIDYSILFTSYYLKARGTLEKEGALQAAYRGSSHSILTSGLILSIVPFVMSAILSDPMIAGILKSLAIGSFCVLLLILFLLPGVLAAMDPLLKKRQG